MNRTWTIVAVLLVLAVALGAYLWTKRSTTPTPQPLLPYTKTESGDRVYTKEGDFYSIKATYPDITPLAKSAGSSADQAAVATMERYIASQIGEFASTSAGEYASLSDELKADMGFTSGRKYQFEVKYEPHQSAAAYSYVFDQYTDMGGAHPNAAYKTFVFDAKIGKELTLADLFVPGSAYLTRVAAAARAQVIEHLKEVLEMPDVQGAVFEEGFAPNEQNYQDFYLDGSNLVVLFDPYQVAAYAAGPQEAHIPLSSLSDILKPEYK
jgi:hypothetical protein